MRFIAMATTALALTAALGGCGGGSGDHKSSSTGTSGTTGAAGRTQAPPIKPATSPLPPGDAGYVSYDYERATFEALLAGVARGRASSGTVKSYADRVLRDRGRIAGEDLALAKQLKLKIVRRTLPAAQREAVRKLVPLTGGRFDAAYLALEKRNIPGDVSRSITAARDAQSPKTRSAAAKRLAVYRAELAAAGS
jgi:predicted outer membrane protein